MGDVIFGIIIGIVLGLFGGVVFGVWMFTSDINDGDRLFKDCQTVTALEINDGVPEYPSLYYCKVYE